MVLTRTQFAPRLARPNDVGSVTSCVCEAYLPYIERLGRQPAPMLDDYADAIAREVVHVMTVEHRVIGVLVMNVARSELWIDNIAVRPEFQRSGIGLRLLELAEEIGREGGFASLQLYTNILMVENRAWYARHGFVEYGQYSEGYFSRVILRKLI